MPAKWMPPWRPTAKLNRPAPRSHLPAHIGTYALASASGLAAPDRYRVWSPVAAMSGDGPVECQIDHGHEPP